MPLKWPLELISLHGFKRILRVQKLLAPFLLPMSGRVISILYKLVGSPVLLSCFA